MNKGYIFRLPTIYTKANEQYVEPTRSGSQTKDVSNYDLLVEVLLRKHLDKLRIEVLLRRHLDNPQLEVLHPV